MFVIGQFAQLAKVSVRTLRHYDDVGLLRPARVDASSGYRFYRADQLSELNRILVLKDLGFTLAEITRLTEAGVTAEELAGMMRLRRAEAERAATLVHEGDMAGCDRSYQVLQQWIDDANETPVGFSREIYLDCSGDREGWVTELQFELA